MLLAEFELFLYFGRVPQHKLFNGQRAEPAAALPAAAHPVHMPLRRTYFIDLGLYVQS